MKSAIYWMIAILGAFLFMHLWASDQHKGAKALYYDQTSGATVQSGSGASAGKTAAAQPGYTGLKYWVELVQPNSSQILRVSSTRAFHSGERIRLHFESNMDGRIVLVQINPNGTSQMLYPDQRINGGDDHIKAGVDTTVPPGNAWFTFDNNPGTERLLVFLNSDSGLVPRSSHGNRARAENENMIASNGKLDAAATSGLASQVEKQRGGKSLVLEVDDKSDSPADYAVRPVSYKQGDDGAGKALAIEIQLKHQ
ncbi:MAG TPA: DUF4384 domain-containing protein [Candidatus Angelobacter sp.]|nr:DUF4384 domain-containing protein [Candidatus Angelobacter sp.]